MTSKEDSIQQYLKSHKILQLIESMTTLLIFNQPDDPKEFLIKHIEKLILARQTQDGFPTVFNRENLLAIFRLVDPIKSGFITKNQFSTILTMLGATDFNQYPAGAEVNQINEETFLQEATKEFEKASKTWKDSF